MSSLVVGAGAVRVAPGTRRSRGRRRDDPSTRTCSASTPCPYPTRLGCVVADGFCCPWSRISAEYLLPRERCSALRPQRQVWTAAAPSPYRGRGRGRQLVCPPRTGLRRLATHGPAPIQRARRERSRGHRSCCQAGRRTRKRAPLTRPREDGKHPPASAASRIALSLICGSANGSGNGSLSVAPWAQGPAEPPAAGRCGGRPCGTWSRSTSWRRARCRGSARRSWRTSARAAPCGPPGR
jgi:hypothetical protein